MFLFHNTNLKLAGIILQFFDKQQDYVYGSYKHEQN